MCEKCKEIDEKISHYRRFATYPFDRLTTERIVSVIAELQQMRDSMHPSISPPSEAE